MSGRQASRAELGILIGLATLPYLTVIDGPFLYDDTLYVVDNHQVTQPGYWSEILTTSYPPGRESQGLYRPLVTLSFALDHAVAGLSSWMFHVTNILLHAGATLAGFFLLRAWLPATALWGAALFAVHPVHTEAVCWIVGRAELLCGLLVFLALRVASQRVALAMVLLLLALLSKEMAIAAPLLVVLPALFLGGSRRAMSRAFLGLMLALVVYLAIRAGVLGGLTPRGSQQVLEGAGLLERIPAMFAVFAEYVRLCLMPAQLSVDYTWATLPTWTTPLAWIGALLFIVVAVSSWRLRETVPWLPFTSAWFVVALTPVSHIFPIGASYAERFLYIPSLGVCVAVAALLQRIPSRRLGAGLLGVLVVASCGWILARSQDWRDEERFYRVSIQASPGCVTLKNNLGRLYADREDFAAATRLFEDVVKLDGGHAPALCNLGICRAQAGRLADARALMEEALRQDPGYARGYINLAKVHLLQGRPELARGLLQRALKLSPGHPGATQALRSLR